MSFEIGEIVGAYKIVGLIGSGGAGRVFKVEHVITRRIEAIKVLFGRPGAPEQAQRFLREIQIQASLSHPNIASVHNAFQVGDHLVMVMELVEGESLKQILERGRIPLDTALDYTGQALSALEYAHGRAVTHRDITPGNMIVTAAGTIKLTDFGLAKSPADMRLTQTGAVLGSIYYMSPEQVRAEPNLDQGAQNDVVQNGRQLNRAAPRVVRRWGMGVAALFAVAALLLNRGSREARIPGVPVESKVVAVPVPALPNLAMQTLPRIAADGAVWAVALSPSGKWLAAGTENRTVEIWNAITGEKRATLRGHTAGVTAVGFSLDERSLVSGSADRTAKVWDLRTNAERNNFRVGGFVTR